MHLNTNWRRLVKPPRGDGTRRGVFATRAPHRPSQLALSALRIESVDEAALMGGRARTLSEDVDALIVPHDGLLPSLSVPALFWRHGGFCTDSTLTHRCDPADH